MDARALKKIAGQFGGRKIVALGDYVADEFILGKASRISREAPVLILQYASRKVVLGGGGNAAHNLAALGARVAPVGMVGDDETGRDVVELLRQAGMDVSRMLVRRGYATPTKTRIMAGGDGQHSFQQQLIRVDRGEPGALPGEHEEAILRGLDEQLRDAAALVVSDYQYGALTPRVIEAINKWAARGDRIITVDSRFRMLSFRGVTAVTPNEPEVEEALGVRLDDREDRVRESAERILREVGCRAVLVTRGSRGMALLEEGKKAEFLPVVGSDEISDVTGAGDTVIAIFTLALACGAGFLEAAQLANIGGGIVVMKRGTATVSPGELTVALDRL
ncbi:MAG TPA: PfkB family carbohydrate kinase [Nitrospiria bacterium]